MIFENFENIIMLLCTILGLLYCIFKYIETPRRGYLLFIVYFLACFLSEYYWTVYALIERDDPNVSDFTAYLGWNVSYLVLAVAVFFLRQPKARRYFHPLMLLPIVINVPQFLLYISYGAVLNNIWQVGITTLTAIFSIQSLLYWLFKRKRQSAFPWLSLFVLIYLIMEYAMWTSSCFEWENVLESPYLYCSAIAAVVRIFFVFGTRKHYETGENETGSEDTSNQRYHVVMQTVSALVILGICVAGYFIAASIEPQNIITALFLISFVLVLLIVGLLFFLTFRYRRTMKNQKKTEDAKHSRRTFIFTIVVTLVLMAFVVVINSVSLYRASVVSVYEEGEDKIKMTATDLENYLTVAETTLRVTADSVDLMENSGRSPQEIEQYLVDQTNIQSEQFDENFTGIYAYINGQFMDGSGWVPPEDYEPTERDWYQTTVDANGEVVIVSPYVDAQTGSVVITVGKKVSNSKNVKGPQMPNVVCLDVIVNHVQEVAEEVDIAGKGYGMVVNEDGFIIAHRVRENNGKNITDIYDTEFLQKILNAPEGRFVAESDNAEYTLFVSPIMDQWYAVINVSNEELFDETYSQLTLNILVSLIIFCLITFFYYFAYKNERLYGKKVEAMNIQVVTSLATAIDAKDTYTNGHSSRVAEYARMIAARAGYSKAEQDEIYMMGLLHDVGKIGVPDEEFEKIKEHPVIGSDILGNIKERPELVTGARWHHERYGGGGYPDGITGEEIPEAARIIAVADAYDAMTSRRSYRDVMPQDVVRGEIEKGKGTQFDPRFAELMLEMIDEDTDYSMREK